ncbi:patatin-like phospholipase family protein [Rhizobacter sp. Root404]|uniref:patatin-like phospholipase family protein n=1 Tax=Rhizobacter sp. Root404 TaxID=1736528 RepID=UPI0009E8FB71|nr:patatin-like phospholipase family protein [Rhizobacter sp. Root404]
MSSSRPIPSAPAVRLHRPDEDCILVLQGGGALGAYQAGVFESLAGVYSEPTWVAGISIGAINAALIAGNPPERRVERLREFWDLVSSAVTTPSHLALPPVRERINEFSASQAMLFGVPGFFSPRWPPAPVQPAGSVGSISWYDTAPLKATLERLVDFDRINAGPLRLSIGAVNVRNGNFEYFDSTKQAIDARHIMASGALPPGFPPVEIDGEHYWDGGLVSNTPLQYVLDQPGQRRRVVFQVDLFPATGALPRTLAEVTEREKDIRFSSRTRLNTTNELDRQVIAQAARRLIDKLPPALRDDPDVRALAQLRPEYAVDVVHLIYRSKHYESQSKDYEFSRLSMREHWDAGRTDMAHTLHDPRWIAHRRADGGVHVFDLTAESRSTSIAHHLTAQGNRS